MLAYEQLGVYKKAYNTYRTIYAILKQNSSIPQYIRSQLGRASLSIVLNIAEGSAKKSLKDRRNFLVIARGSTFECNSIINLLADEKEIENELKEQLHSTFDEISRMLYAMIQNLDRATA